MPLEFPALCELFFTKHLQHHRAASPQTLETYGQAFRLFTKFAAKEVRCVPSELKIGKLDADLVSRFLDYLEADRKNSARTRNNRLAALQSFYSYIGMECPQHAETIAKVLAIPMKRFSQRLVPYLSRDEVGALLSRKSSASWHDRRNYVLFLTMIETGMRVSETTALTFKNVNFGRGPHIFCLGKGRRERPIPLTNKTVGVLKNWYTDNEYTCDSFVFATKDGDRLSSDAVQQALGGAVQQGAIVCPSLLTKRVTPHVLRHTCAMDLLQSGVTLEEIALWLGHASLNTTQIYLDADLAFRQKISSKRPETEGSMGRFIPSDRLLEFLKNY